MTSDQELTIDEVTEIAGEIGWRTESDAPKLARALLTSQKALHKLNDEWIGLIDYIGTSGSREANRRAEKEYDAFVTQVKAALLRLGEGETSDEASA